MRFRRRRPDAVTPNPIELSTPEPEESVHVIPAPAPPVGEPGEAAASVHAGQTDVDAEHGAAAESAASAEEGFAELLELFPGGLLGDADPSPLGIAPVGGIGLVDDPSAAPQAGVARVPTLVIGDDDVEPAAPSAESPSAAVAVDPRMRRRRIAVRRAAGRKRLLVVIVLAVVALTVVGALIVVASPLFKVTNVQISGATYTTADDLAPIVDQAKKGAILLLDTDAIETRLEQLPWVRAARVEADFPSTLKIELDERVPIASYQGPDGSWRVIDRDGRVLAVIPDGARPADYLPIEGSGPDAVPGAFAGDPLRIAAELVLSLPAELRSVTSAVTLGADGRIGMRLTSDTVVTFGQPSDLRAKLAVLIVLLRDHPPATLASVDVSDPNNPAATPVGR